MADLPPYPGSGDKSDDDVVGLERRSPRSPWLYLSWIIGIALILLVVVLHVSGAIGPGVH